LAPLGGVMSAWPLLGRTPSPASFKRLPWAWPPDGTARLHHEITPALWRGVARHQAIGAHFDAVLDGLASWTERAIDAVSAQLPAGFPGSLSHTVFEGLRRSARTLAP
jgi:serine/threonine-protein kinase HipA